LSLYDKRGERLSTEYLGAMPEAGKADFTKRFTSRVARVLALYPKALHVVLSDGACRREGLAKLKAEGHCYPDKDYEREHDHDMSGF
jgi:hypothetical protein